MLKAPGYDSNFNNLTKNINEQCEKIQTAIDNFGEVFEEQHPEKQNNQTEFKIDEETIEHWAYSDPPNKILWALCHGWILAGHLKQNIQQCRCCRFIPAINEAIQNAKNDPNIPKHYWEKHYWKQEK